MSRALLGASSALSFGLLVHLLHHFSSPDTPPPLDFACPVCLEGLHWPSLGLGVLIGFLVWPVLEVLLYLRAFLFCSLLRVVFRDEPGSRTGSFHEPRLSCGCP